MQHLPLYVFYQNNSILKKTHIKYNFLNIIVILDTAKMSGSVVWYMFAFSHSEFCAHKFFNERHLTFVRGGRQKRHLGGNVLKPHHVVSERPLFAVGARIFQTRFWCLFFLAVAFMRFFFPCIWRRNNPTGTGREREKWISKIWCIDYWVGVFF